MLNRISLAFCRWIKWITTGTNPASAANRKNGAAKVMAGPASPGSATTPGRTAPTCP